VNRTARDRVTIDLRGLRPAVQALARHRRVTIAALGRAALVRMLGPSRDTAPPVEPPRILPDQKKQFTVRMYRSDIERVVTHARALGASYGTYLSALIDGAPPPLIIDPQQAIAALAGSTDRLMAIAADLNELMRSIRRGAIPSAGDCGRPVEELTHLIRPHLESASRLMADLLPARPRRLSRRRRRTQRIKS
jgi:hypothetical protein